MTTKYDREQTLYDKAKLVASYEKYTLAVTELLH